MARRTEALRHSPPRAEVITFVRAMDERRVDLHEPRSLRRGTRCLVQLMDLWVATLLPGDFLDLSFGIVTAAPDGALSCSAPLDALAFARGFVDRATRELWWDDPAECPLRGLRVYTIVVLGGESAAESAPPRPRSLDLARLLPHVAHAYPPVEWRVAPDPRATRRTS